MAIEVKHGSQQVVIPGAFGGAQAQTRNRVQILAAQSADARERQRRALRAQRAAQRRSIRANQDEAERRRRAAIENREDVQDYNEEMMSRRRRYDLQDQYRQEQRMLEGRKYQEGRIAEQRKYQEGLTAEQRKYQEGLISGQRTYEEERRIAERQGQREDYVWEQTTRQKAEEQKIRDAIADLQSNDSYSEEEREIGIRQLENKLRGTQIPIKKRKEQSPWPEGQGVGQTWAERGILQTRDPDGKVRKIGQDPSVMTFKDVASLQKQAIDVLSKKDAEGNVIMPSKEKVNEWMKQAVEFQKQMSGGGQPVNNQRTAKPESKWTKPPQAATPEPVGYGKRGNNEFADPEDLLGDYLLP